MKKISSTAKSFITILLYLLHQAVISHIVGGYEVTPSFKYNFIASIQANGNPFCAGTLITTNMIISAAHCVPEDAPKLKIEAVLHRHDINLNDDDEEGIRRRVFKIRKHDEFDKGGASVNDISLFKLNDSVPFNPNIIMDSGERDIEGLSAFVIGWGTQITEDTYISKMLETPVGILYSDECVSILKEKGAVINPKIQICAGYPQGGHDSCQGDSGGPIFIIDKNNQTILVGIVSWGFGCGEPNSPGIYTRVSAFNNMIMDNISTFN